MFFWSTVSLLCIVILASKYRSLDSFTRDQQSNQQGLEHCRAFDKGFLYIARLCRQQESLKKLMKRKEF